MKSEMTAPEILEEIVTDAQAKRASDIHLQMVDADIELYFRIDGVLQHIGKIPTSVPDQILGRIKYLAKLKTYQESLPQEGRINKGLACSQSDIRVSTYPTITGEKIVLRLFQNKEILTIDKLNFPQDACAELIAFLKQPSGMLLLTGPCGSGKTTTIYACLKHLVESGGRHIITIEDPVEQIIPGIMQTEINVERGLTFPKASKYLLRHDPQIIVLGEIRDEETAQIAVRASFTGHMVISTLHAGSCKGVIERMLMMCEDKYSTISALSLIINQRLLRLLCPYCQGKKCDHCMNIGYLGRTPLVEYLKIDKNIKKLIQQTGVDNISPLHSMMEVAQLLIQEKITNETEVMSRI